jgi:hypothetical protein
VRISLSVAVTNRQFGKNVRAVRPFFVTMFEEFGAVELENPIHEAMLIAITDGEPEGSFKKIANKDGYFQILAGVKPSAEGDELKATIFSIICKAVNECPFSQPDKRAFRLWIDTWSKAFIS